MRFSASPEAASPSINSPLTHPTVGSVKFSRSSRTASSPTSCAASIKPRSHPSPQPGLHSVGRLFPSPWAKPECESAHPSRYPQEFPPSCHWSRPKPQQIPGASAGSSALPGCLACGAAWPLHCVPPSQSRPGVHSLRAAPASDLDGSKSTATPRIRDKRRRQLPWRPRIASSLRAPPQQDDFDGLEHDQQIQTEGSVLDIKQVVLQFLSRVFQRVAVLVLHLCPARDARPHHVPYAVVGDIPAQPLHKFRPLRARTYKMHVALQHAPQLRNFIEPRNAQELARARDSRIIVQGPGCPCIRFGVHSHGAELVAVKNSSPTPHALLAVQHRTRRIQLDSQHNERQQGQRDHSSGKRYRNVQCPAHQPDETAEAEAFGKDQPAGV